MRHGLDKISSLILRTILPITVFVTPLLFLPITPNFFDFNKTYFIYLLASISLIAWTIRSIARQKISLTIAPATLPLIFLSLIYVISSVFQSSTPLINLFGRTALIVSLTIIFLSTTTSQKNSSVISISIFSLILSICALSLFTVLQYMGLLHNLLSIDLLKDKSFNPSGGIFQYLSISLPLIPALIYYLFRPTKYATKTLTAIALITILSGVISQVSLLASSGGFFWPFLPATTGWSITLDIFKNLKTALLGIGPENFLSAFTRLRPIYLNTTPIWNIRFTSSSNELFHIITTTGILGGLFWITSIAKSLSAAKNSSENRFLLIILTSYTIITLIVPANVSLLTLTFASLSLLTLQLKTANHASIKDTTLNLLATSTQSLSSPKSANIVLIFLFSLPATVLLIVFWIFATKNYLAALATGNAIKSISSNPAVSYEEQIKAYSLDPTNITYRINFSQTSLAMANSIASQKDLTDQNKSDITQLVQQAIREAKNAAQINPQNVLAWENLASVYNQIGSFAQGSTDWTIASYNQAISLDPTNPSLRLSLGSVFFALSDFDNAIKVLGQATDLKPDWANAHYNLAAAYKANKNLKKAVEEMRIVVQLVSPNSEDYQKAQNELSELEKQLPKEPISAPAPETTKNPNNIELVTPTPTPAKKPLPTLPETSAPQLPSPSPTPN